jgi:hypothetical protein
MKEGRGREEGRKVCDQGGNAGHFTALEPRGEEGADERFHFAGEILELNAGGGGGGGRVTPAARQPPGACEVVEVGIGHQGALLEHARFLVPRWRPRAAADTNAGPLLTAATATAAGGFERATLAPLLWKRVFDLHRQGGVEAGGAWSAEILGGVVQVDEEGGRVVDETEERRRQRLRQNGHHLLAEVFQNRHKKVDDLVHAGLSQVEPLDEEELRVVVEVQDRM